VIVYFSVILSYVVVIHWNAKNYNNGFNINNNVSKIWVHATNIL